MTEIFLTDKGGATCKAVDVGGGQRLAAFFKTPEEIKDIFDNVPNLTFRDDDVLISSYPKTGSQWLMEVTAMILQKSTAKIETAAAQTVLEFHREQDIQKVPSPRILQSHLSTRFLPNDLVRKQIKTIMIVRNPKDMAVSYYHHHAGVKVFQYSGKWEDWLPLFIDGEVIYGHYSDHLNEWAEIIHNGPQFPLHWLYYEDLKEHGVREIIRLSKFLGVDIDDQLAQEINEACSFKNMADNKLTEDVKKMMFKDHFQFFRKGEIGDWRNYFSQEQSEQFDTVWDEKLKDTVFEFRYEPSPTSS